MDVMDIISISSSLYQNQSFHKWVSMFILILSCTSKDEPQKSQSTLTMEYYTAQSLITLYNGIEFEESYIVQREIDHDKLTIDETFISTIDGTSIFVMIQADTNTQSFDLVFSDESYVGQGTYEGEGMLWNSWESVSQHTDGSYVLSSDTKENADIKTQKEGYAEDDTLQWTMDEYLTSISKDEYEEIFLTLP